VSTPSDRDLVHELGYELAKLELERQVGRMRDLRTVAAPLAASAVAVAAFIAPRAIDRIRAADDVSATVWFAAAVAGVFLLGALFCAGWALLPRRDFSEALDADRTYREKLLPLEDEPDRAYASLIGLHAGLRDTNRRLVDDVATAVSAAGLFAAGEVLGLVLTLFLPI
jgi:predicted RNA-binding Zn ribbon-like protein